MLSGFKMNIMSQNETKLQTSSRLGCPEDMTAESLQESFLCILRLGLMDSSINSKKYKWEEATQLE